VDMAQAEAFLALAEELHFGRAAQRLCVSQPRVSRLIASLEREIGAPLFERTSRCVAMTPLGEQFLSQLQPGYAQMQTAVGRARAAARGVTGELIIGFTATTPSEPLNRLVQAFEARHPECLVTLSEHPSAGDDWDIWRPLRQGQSDVLVYLNGFDEPGLSIGPVIAWLDRVLLVGRGHRLAGLDSVSAEELASEQVTQRPPSLPPAIMDMLIPPLTPSGRPIPRSVPFRSLHEIASLVARGRIVHPTGDRVVLFRRDDIVQVPIRDLPPVPLGLIWCTAHENARIRALAATARSLGQSRTPGSFRDDTTRPESAPRSGQAPLAGSAPLPHVGRHAAGRC
jgi:DNA-binding transcriptional LysR family regulator